MGIRPTYSIIMTSYNYAQYIGAAIDSVLAQTFEDWELLIVDDRSTDDSWRVIQSFTDPRIKSHRQAVNTGACAAYNHALSMARGIYIASLDSDDLYMPTKLAQQAEFLAAHPMIDIYGTFVTEICSDGVTSSDATPFEAWFNVQMDLNDPTKWTWENRLCHSGVVVRADFHRLVGEFNNGLVYTPDWQFWIRALVVGARFAVSTQPLVGYRNHGGNITHKNRQSTLLEHARTAAHIFVPWLCQQGRLDLIDKVFEGFISNSLIASENHLQSQILETLLSSTVAADISASILRVAVRQSMDLISANNLNTDLQNETKQVEFQIKRLSAENTRLTSHCDTLEKSAAQKEADIAWLRMKLQEK